MLSAPVLSYSEKQKNVTLLCMRKFRVGLTEQLEFFARMVWNSENLPVREGISQGSIGSVTPTKSFPRMVHKWDEWQGQ